MAHRPRPDPDFDFAEEKALAAYIERLERDRRILAEISEIGRDLAKATEEYAKARAESAGAAAGDTGKPEFDHAATLAGLAKTIRLNDALDAKLARAIQARITRSSSEATGRRQARDPARKVGSGVTLH